MKPTTEELRMAGSAAVGVLIGHGVAWVSMWTAEKIIKWAKARAAKAAATSK